MANFNIANTQIFTGPVDMTGFVSMYGNGNIPEFSPITIVSHVSPAAYWEPSAGTDTWNGSTAVWSSSSAQQLGLHASAGTNTATFDDSGLSVSSLVNIVGLQSTAALTVTNSAGTYNFSGG